MKLCRYQSQLILFTRLQRMDYQIQSSQDLKRLGQIVNLSKKFTEKADAVSVKLEVIPSVK